MCASAYTCSFCSLFYEFKRTWMVAVVAQDEIVVWELLGGIVKPHAGQPVSLFRFKLSDYLNASLNCPCLSHCPRCIRYTEGI
jgi:hypothetical protein